MLFKLEHPKILSDAISLISEIVTEVRIKLQPEGISIVAVDPANVAMVLFKVPKESFSQYEAGTDIWGVNLDDLKRILKRATSSASVVFEQDENRLKVTIFDKVKRNFTLSLIEVESEDKEEPALEFASTVEMPSNSFAQAIEDCAVVADSCSLSTGADLFIIQGSGSLNSAKAEFSSDEATIQGLANSKYSLQYLIKFIKAQRISDKVSIKYSDNYPLRLDFPGEKIGIGFVLAPRVEND